MPTRQGAGRHLLSAERALQTAQRSADVDALDALLHPRSVAAGPDGSVFTKDDDLRSHRSGALRITSLVEEHLEVEEAASTGVTRLLAAVEALQDGSPVSVRLRYTRLWVRDGDRWRVLAATLAPA
ncbi:nuclear transport factor 2 family protein [Quadrisphaera granulorum]|uniref:nuclear transport factor 2 family protein n=1 Tax=Quadrisphaera granulorum TaxID=317664 RepID=UPI001B87BDF8|nr:nuclear transport factor 2 family protein [Quadrisphaera granulorum]